LYVDGISGKGPMRVTIKNIIDFFRSPEVVITLLVLILFTSGFTIYAINRPATPTFHIYDASFKFGEDSRVIEITAEADRGKIELNQFFINDEAVPAWDSDKKVIAEGETSRCLLDYPWKMGNIYRIKLVATDGKSAELVTEAPEVTSSLKLASENITSSQKAGSITVNATYSAFSNGTDSLHVLLFTYQSYENAQRSIYIFYDTQYMTEETLRRADAIIDYFDVYAVDIEKVDYNDLESMSDTTKSILILLNPLKDKQGKQIENVIPAPLIDTDRDGFIKDDSRYGKSLLYDMMYDNDLILVTVGTLQPYKRILYRDGVYNQALDSTVMFDANHFLTEATNGESIINGSFVLGNYSAVRISGTMGLSVSRSSFGFDKNAMERHALHYYGYGDYNLTYNDANLNLTLPVFIQVSEDGGWLAMGDDKSGLDSEQLAHDLFLIYLQSIWDSNWIPYGWYWDSASTFKSYGGEFNVTNNLATSIPTKILGDTIVVRLVAIAYSSELDKGLLAEQTVEYEIR
jgi:hypothetical protein